MRKKGELNPEIEKKLEQDESFDLHFKKITTIKDGQTG